MEHNATIEMEPNIFFYFLSSQSRQWWNEDFAVGGSPLLCFHSFHSLAESYRTPWDGSGENNGIDFFSLFNAFVLFGVLFTEFIRVES